MGAGSMAFEAIATGDKDFIVSASNRKTGGIPQRWLDEKKRTPRIGGVDGGSGGSRLNDRRFWRFFRGERESRMHVSLPSNRGFMK